MSGVFLDTVGILALWDQSDQWHVDAEAAYQDLVAACTPLVTTELILFECSNAAARRPYRDQVDQLRRLLQLRNELIAPSADDIEQAWDAHQETRMTIRSIGFWTTACANVERKNVRSAS